MELSNDELNENNNIVSILAFELPANRDELLEINKARKYRVEAIDVLNLSENSLQKELDKTFHETSNDADAAPMDSWFQSGYFSISEGDMMSFIDLVWPDMKFGQLDQSKTAHVNISFLVTNYPGDTPTVYGPYTVTQATDYFNTRLRGRLVAVKIASNDLGSFWRIGALRYRFMPDGKF